MAFHLACSSYQILAPHLFFAVYSVPLLPYKPGHMQIPIEPNLDKEIPTIAQPQTGETYEQRMKIAANTALALKELGADDDVTPEEAQAAKSMFENMLPGDKNSRAKPEEKKALATPGIAMALSGYINHYEKQIVADKVQVRTIVVNRLMEISQDDDNKVALKALELLGKASDLFTDRSEITITHQTSDELKAAIKERITQLMQSTQIKAKTKTESRLDQLKDVQDVEVVEIKDADNAK